VFVDESGLTTDLFRRYARTPRGAAIPSGQSDRRVWPPV